MTIQIKAPTFPESVADGTIANWLKKEGDIVKQDEIIAEIETDKVVLEVVAPNEGKLSKIIKAEGDIVLSAEIIGEFDNSSTESTQQDLKVNKTSEQKPIE
ncbi:biotin/lipoyl-binding protein, partial [Gammaproteobacteria bacterium]|nr:biotin/lipoyl-binding protein [Gammaproteobacteria bacterium]